MRERTWALRLEIDGLAEITLATAADFGLGATDDPRDCQELGRRLRDVGKPETDMKEIGQLRLRHLCGLNESTNDLFGGSSSLTGSPYLADPISAVDVPASITAHAARPILSLLDVVRFEGEPHAELEAFKRDEEFHFDEPGLGTHPVLTRPFDLCHHRDNTRTTATPRNSQAPSRESGQRIRLTTCGA